MAREQEATILLSTPTFLRIYESQIPPADFRTVNMIATGAEQLPADLADRVVESFGTRPFEGYGVTETSPAIAFNVPEDRWSGAGAAPILAGTVGTPIPGIEVKVVDRITHAELPPGQEGLLWVKGPNVMKGYLHRQDLTAQVIENGWYNTRDIVRIDENGFITITGRVSQFSKIGGEMVPHLHIEESISGVLRTEGQEEARVAVTSVPHRTRGERVVVLHTELETGPDQIISLLRAQGLPPLYLPDPDSFVEVVDIPFLGSGNIDLARLRSLAQQFFDEDGNPIRTTTM